ncbi:hypothetical protein C0V70_07710 [Bacteriovorax stolpii]|uniref:Uncharacterized protein n=1 Tax=Bacteriovorax stolpii TaxID=960 RepID=A0A2K9NSC5_BACTC|nr:hypothetical protein [Bacteriovorax stolpii]AUN97995.1 hypothetical protein C0V70_07710 [Bacteriovorax stolpii]TDP50317.1 hypothetical protein C8D79_3820 [Bacteriovorax stolpii]
MEKVKYDLLRAMIIIVLVSVVASAVVSSSNNLLKIVAMTTSVTFIVMPIIVGRLWFFNKKSKNGVYFSKNEITIFDGDEEYHYPWAMLQIEYKILIPFYCKRIIFSLEKEKRQIYKYDISLFNSKSFYFLVKKYAPSTHSFPKKN